MDRPVDATEVPDTPDQVAAGRDASSFQAGAPPTTGEAFQAGAPPTTGEAFQAGAPPTTGEAAGDVPATVATTTERDAAWATATVPSAGAADELLPGEPGSTTTGETRYADACRGPSTDEVHRTPLHASAWVRYPSTSPPT